MPRALSVFLGRTAAREIQAHGWTPELFGTLLGASGGPKWFILRQLDEMLFGDFLQRSDRPLVALGSSIGTWRHACLAMADPVAAIHRLERGYLYQRYSARPTVAEVSEVSMGVIESVLGAQGGEQLATHPRIHSHIVTARGRGLTGRPGGAGLAAGMGAAALGNALGRRTLERAFQRVVFHSGAEPANAFRFDDFATCHASIAGPDVKRALSASGAIPFVLAGEHDIPNAPGGHYWDGGIIDYHFDLRRYTGEGLLLYPHFSATVIAGWFDKFLPWRTASYNEIDKLVLLCPSDEFIASLPHGKIPDRSDFRKMGEDQRIRYWEECVARGRDLAEEFAALIAGDDPLAGVQVLR